jgi:peroxiredoxin
MNKLIVVLLVLFTSRSVIAVEAEELVPDFTLKTMNGDNVRLEELRGQVVLINFWASWCGPCRQEMPLLQKIQDRYEPLGFTVLGVNVDEQEEKARRIVDRMSLDFPLLLDTTQSVSEAYEVDAMPFSVLVDRNGKISYIHRGYKPGDENQYVNRLKQLLRQPSATAGQ